MSYYSGHIKYILNWLIAGTRGGVMRARIIMALRDSPMNANQLADYLGVDYRTVRHHLEILERNKIVASAGEKYGVTYFLTPLMEENYSIFEEIWEKIGKKEKRR
ncbi:MAG: winged helix-turn-helix domain-containing protein [Candidatus Bathyarchaeia archaeon]|nr:winged helix-turn-helix transcriptional regulator [Candidatus Bathyarchaeota archaeon]